MKTQTSTSVDTKKTLNMSMKFQKMLPSGNFINRYLYNRKVQKKLAKLGLETNMVKFHRESSFQIIATGEKSKLWELVNWSRNAPLFHKFKEVNFQFVDLVEVEVSLK